ncbi:unnamed protein product [Oikopleura dioica]|uniref:Uncharacterized protein n=1 Tax=Oikopleura dioica TaxID=34765 RepID=E4XR22_OIKDI|nr:unnamed protein product [Oikopleura dioica]
MEYAKRKIHFASPEVAQVQEIYSAEPSEIAIKEENHQLQQKESDILTHEKLAVKKEGNTENIRKVYSCGDSESQDAALKSTVQEKMETEELAKNLDDSTDAVEPQLQEISVDEIMEPSGQKTTYTQVTSREDEIIEKNFEKSVQVTDGLHQAQMYRFNDATYSVSSRTLPKSTFRSEVYRPDDDGSESSLASDETCDCCSEKKVPPRFNSLQKALPPPVPPHRVHLKSCEASGIRRNAKYPDCSCGYKWQRDFESTDDSSMLSRIGARLIGSRTSNTNTSVSEGDYCVHEN